MLVRAETKLVNKDTAMQQHRDASLCHSDEEIGPGGVTVMLLRYTAFTFPQSCVVLSFETESYSIAQNPNYTHTSVSKVFPQAGYGSG